MVGKTIEIEEKSIDEAIEKACREFNVPREKLNIEIISESSGGFLGVLSKKAKIRASLLSLDMSLELSDNYPAKVEAPKIETKKQPAIQETSVTPLSSETSLAPQAKDLLEGILTRMTFDCRVKIQETQDKIILNIEGEGTGLLIGKRGQNLDAVQYILNKAINKSDTSRKMIMIDAEDYRKRRQESLLGLAEKISEKVKKTKKPVSLSHMNAHDRRIIHLALQNDQELITKSRGEGEYRKIVILPARRSNSRPPRDRRRKAEIKN